MLHFSHKAIHDDGGGENAKNGAAHFAAAPGVKNSLSNEIFVSCSNG